MRAEFEELGWIWRERLFPWLRGHLEILLSALAIAVSLYTYFETTKISDNTYIVGFRFEKPRAQSEELPDLRTLSLQFQAINGGNRPSIIERVFIQLQDKNDRSCRDPENNTHGQPIRGVPVNSSATGFLPTVNLAPGSATEVTTEFRDLELPRDKFLAACFILVGYNFKGEIQFASTYFANINYWNVEVVDWPKRMEFIR